MTVRTVPPHANPDRQESARMVTNLLHPPRVSAGVFRYNAYRREFTEEASTLEGHGFRLGAVYADACDVGFTMVGRTGREVVFSHSGQERDAEGDLLLDRFESLGANGRPDGRYTAVVFND